MRILLIQPPFWAVNSPSIGLSYLKAALRATGTDVELLYSNLDFANLIGRGDYDTIQTRLPVELLFGDLVFGAALQGTSIPFAGIPDLMRSILARPPGIRTIPDAFLDRFPEFSQAAVRFVREFQEAAPWKGWDLVGFTTTFTLVPALAMAKAMKETDDAPPIIFGGSHCDGSLGLALMNRFPWIDYIGRGDGERLVISLARQLESETPTFDAIDGLIWREGGEVREAGQHMARTQDLDSLPMPRYEDWLKHVEAQGWKDPCALRIPIETSRGCWYGDTHRCSFCGLNGLNDQFRTKSADRILSEYAALLEYGIPFFNAVDNVLDPNHFREVIPRIAALEKKATMFYEIRPTHTKNQLIALENAGIRLLQPGIESLSTRLLKLMNKGTSALQNVRLLRWTAELGMPVLWNMLHGLPGEDAADYDDITTLISSLTHLFPPMGGCNRIHVDRFSPLFIRHEAAIQPIAPYALALGLEPHAARDLAYHFEFTEDRAAVQRTSRAIERLNEAIVLWQNSVGSAAFVSLDREGRRWLYDTRPGAKKQEALLEGLEAELSRLLDAGVSREEIDQQATIPSTAIDTFLDEYSALGWIHYLDGRYISLSVPMDARMPAGIPESMQGTVVTGLYEHHAHEMWKSVTP
jgi:ribosomal peptide maturation radical SAM protein 1